MSIKTCNTCSATTKRGTQCTKRTCVSDLCWIHLKQQGFRIKDSVIPGAGKGLFVLKEYAPNENITLYTGDESKDPIDGVYVLKINNQLYIDGAKTDEPGLGRWINQCRTNQQRNRLCNNNSKFSYDYRNQKTNIKATRRIPAGQEVFLSYGPSYWNQV